MRRELFIGLTLLLAATGVACGDRVQFHVLDATDKEALTQLGEARFDALACTMALMDMARIEPLATGVSRLLCPTTR